LKYDLEKEHFHFEEKKVNILNEQRNLRKQKEQQQREDVVFDEDGFMVVKDDFKRRRRDETEANPMEDEAKLSSANAYLNVKKKVKSNFFILFQPTLSIRSNNQEKPSDQTELAEM